MLIDVEKLPFEEKENVLEFVKEIESCNKCVKKADEYIEIEGVKIPLMQTDAILAFAKEADMINEMFVKKS